MKRPLVIPKQISHVEQETGKPMEKQRLGEAMNPVGASTDQMCQRGLIGSDGNETNKTKANHIDLCSLFSLVGVYMSLLVD